MSELDDAIAALERAVARLEAAPPPAIPVTDPRVTDPRVTEIAAALVTRVDAALARIGQVLGRAEMAQVIVKVNGRDFSLACEDGQEPRIRRLAQYVDSKVVDFVKSNGQVGEARLILLAAILIADELSDANDALQRERSGRPAQPADSTATAIRDIAQRIESIAGRRETP